MAVTILVKNPINGICSFCVDKEVTGSEVYALVAKEIHMNAEFFHIAYGDGEVLGRGDTPARHVQDGYVFTVTCEGAMTGSGWDSDAERFDEEVTTPSVYGSTRSVKAVRRKSKLGEGAYGWVYNAEIRDTGEQVACKVLNVSNMKRISRDQGDTGVPMMALREISTMKLCGDPSKHTLPLLEVLQNSMKMPILVLPKMDVDLSHLLKRKGCLPLPAHQIVSKAILTAVSHLHSHDIMHRDIKPANVLLSKAGGVMLCDYGMSRCMSEEDKLKPVSPLYSRMTLPYRPPECLLGKEDYGLTVDVWSTGMTLAEAWVGKHLLENYTSEIPVMTEVVELVGWPPTEEEWPCFSELSTLKLFQLSAMSPVLQSRLPDNTPAHLSSFLLSLLTRSPYRRPSAASHLDSPYLSDHPADLSSLIDPDKAARSFTTAVRTRQSPQNGDNGD